MSLLLGFFVVLAICFIAIFFFPQPRYGQMRGCTGRALQATMEQRAKNKDAGLQTHAEDAVAKPEREQS